MSSYTILGMDKMPESLKKKPGCMKCVALALGILAVTLSSVGVGVFIGYTYCYIEHRTGFRRGNFTQLEDYIIRMPFLERNDTRYENNTINVALMSNVLVSKLLSFGHSLIDDHSSKSIVVSPVPQSQMT